MTANNVTRMLEARKVPFTALDVPVQKLSALEVADLLEMPPETVFKTIVARREKGGKPILALVPATGEVDNKALAAALKEKKVHVTSQAEAEALTGLRAGGISPLALINKGFQVLIDNSAETLESMLISGGQWGLQIRLAPKDLAKLTNARFAPIANYGA
ncbi:aminoacyl-tRNA deacylase [Pelolinea submarina]|uniref:Cys-tRNA(Pro)/Cys-tRNA(Cys) deacylase n=1 Tax=Pelolinea submarina TaxID=913107 RepID=A0A347ZVR3_9CHLR|nr:aminoacyl-tRNA deacylase [Pelolinea submarina]REG07090.1 Cys-tRNA(Pro)/Cys-tRNA(Cys) deacylase [Pelolinea submarina]BBB49394.1 Cys-tRNA(Pro)/Cys-tRNA(Cys) deacylase [Pelolinea submarina]